MKKLILSCIVALLGCQKHPEPPVVDKKEPVQDSAVAVMCSDSCEMSAFACKLTTPELQKRKATVLASLRKQLLEKKELKQGYAFKFTGSDKMVDELSEFIKTERECCDFFTFNLMVSGDKKTAWLELTGAVGVKEFINTELEL